MKRLPAILAGAALLSSGLIAAVPAQATGASPAEAHVSKVSAKSAPSCLKRSVASNKRSVKLKNNCGIPLRINVAFKRAPDTGCYIIWQGESKKHSRTWPAKYTKVKSCGSWP